MNVLSMAMRIVPSCRLDRLSPQLDCGAELAAVGLCRSAFAMRFAATVGMLPIDHVSRWRMLLVRDALATSDLSMAEIAGMIGFQSVSAFSTSFKREVGSPPSAYRKEQLD